MIIKLQGDAKMKQNNTSLKQELKEFKEIEKAVKQALIDVEKYVSTDSRSSASMSTKASKLEKMNC